MLAAEKPAYVLVYKRRLFTSIKNMKKSKRPQMKYNSFRRPNTPEELARAYFDLHYSARFKENWPSMRCAMLSRKKYCGIMNNFSSSDSLEQELLESGAYNFVGEMQEKAKLQFDEICSEIKKVSSEVEQLRAENAQEEWQMLQSADAETHSGYSNGMGETSSIPESHKDLTDNLTSDLMDELKNKDDFYNFISKYKTALTNDVSNQEHHTPDIAILDLIDKLEDLEDQKEVYYKLSRSCIGLKAYVYPKSNITEINTSILHTPITSVYQNFLLDAAAVLPVIALDPKPGDEILDMCAAPGGKLNLILQVVKGEGNVVANEPEKLRLNQMETVISKYLPPDSDQDQHLSFAGETGDFWKEKASKLFSKVLVDVPCTEDRVSMYEFDVPHENIFSQLQKGRRERLPELQADILRTAVIACDIGGIVVYCTNTASHWQNEYVIQYTVQELLSEDDVLCEVVDLKPMEKLLSEEFYFHTDVTVGTLVVPRLDANFGPTYICKLRRVR